MGRGKKKGDKKKDGEQPSTSEEPSLSTLSISETPSSSRETSAPPDDEGGLGLGLSGGRKKTKKPAAAAAPAEVAPAEAPAVPAPTEPAKPIPPEPEKADAKDDDDVGLGLGGGGKKKRPRKKKEAVAEAPAVTAPVAAAGPTAPAPGAAQAAPWAPAGPAVSSQAPIWGRGVGQPQHPGAPPGHSGAPPGYHGPQPGGPTPSFYGSPPPGHPGAPPPGIGAPLPGYGAPSPGHGAPSPGRGAPSPDHGAPSHGYGAPSPGYPGAPSPGYPGDPSPGYPGSPSPGHPGAPPPGHPGASPLGAQPGRGQPDGRGRGIGRGQQPGTSQPHAPGRQPSAQAPVRGSGGDTIVCHFKIPAKIIGNSVRCNQIKVLTNYLPMTIKPLKIFRYDVSFKPDKPKKMIPRAFAIAKGKHFSRHLLAFDQMKNCYALAALPNVTQDDRFIVPVEVTDNNNKIMKIEVSFKATGIVDLGTILNYMKSGTSLNPPTEAIQCVDVILRQGTLENYIKAGRQFFKRPARPIELGDGLEMWTGLFQSAIFTSSPFINIDVAHKGFPKQQQMIDAMKNDFRLELNKPLEQQRGRGIENFRLFIKGLRVMATIGGDSSAKGQRREFICNDLVDPPNKLKFTLTDQATGKSQIMTVADYFAKEKRVRLRYPDLNCMWVGPKDKKIYYPIELLEVSYGQALNKQLNENQLSTMVRQAATPPDERKRKIDEVIRDMKYSQNPYFKQFGLDIKEEFYPVQAKVLMPPKLEVGGGQTVDPRKGQWQANRLLKPEALQSWGFIALECDPHSSNADQIIKLLMDMGGQMGMAVSAPKQTFFNVNIRSLQSTLFTALEKEINFLVIVVATRGRDYYHKVKQFAEREVGILTQCIKEYTATRRMNPQTARNILLKVNSKLMGINQALDNRSLPKCLVGGGVMVVGADVTHPSPDQTSVPSIAAVTASIDPKCFKYNIQLSVQTPKKEMIVEFEDMMVEHLQVYQKHQRALPRKIFVFRDGVSEGQFSQVMNSELTAVHRAYQRMTGTPAKPEVLFLLVQKRHHTRLFLGATNPQNVEPGTVVDTHIVHARELDFYLVSHQAIKGTARPTRYHAVCNDGAIPHDEVEQLTYYLCHLYSRCMRAVSYPTPTYYAHLACLRARSLTYGEKFDNAELEKKPQRLRVMDRILEFSRMFFV